MASRTSDILPDNWEQDTTDLEQDEELDDLDLDALLAEDDEDEPYDYNSGYAPGDW